MKEFTAWLAESYHSFHDNIPPFSILSYILLGGFQGQRVDTQGWEMNGIKNHDESHKE